MNFWRKHFHTPETFLVVALVILYAVGYQIASYFVRQEKAHEYDIRLLDNTYRRMYPKPPQDNPTPEEYRGEK